jgi:hypothetical protein
MNQMKKVYKAHVYTQMFTDGSDNVRGYVGEIEGVYIQTNVAELKNQPIEFYGVTKDALLTQMVKFLKGVGLTGVLRVVN